MSNTSVADERSNTPAEGADTLGASSAAHSAHMPLRASNTQVPTRAYNTREPLRADTQVPTRAYNTRDREPLRADNTQGPSTAGGGVCSEMRATVSHHMQRRLLGHILHRVYLAQDFVATSYVLQARL